jgi:hypothetical protein
MNRFINIVSSIIFEGLKNRLFILFCIASLSLKCQFLDSLTTAIHGKPMLDANLEGGSSFITNQRVKVSGVRLGVVFQNKLRIGGGYSWLAGPVSRDKAVTSLAGNPETVQEYLKFGYFCYYVDFVFHKTKRWQLSVPLQLGTGLSHLEYTQNNILHKSKHYFLLLYEPGINVQFKIFRWAGVGANVGYRFALKNNRYIGEALNSPTYSFNLLIWYDELFFLIAPKSRITKKYGPSTW